MKNFKQYKKLNLSEIHKEVLAQWKEKNIFQQSIDNRKNGENFTFYEGPPSANGMPGIHHVIARTIKDIFCRYKTLSGFKVNRKAGWDTHGLPVELGVEAELNITKEDIGKTISIEEYNKACRKNVMRYKKNWEDITTEMGYWVDMNSPYITYENKYIESVWWLLKELFNKKLLYKGYTVQPFSPKAGTGLSTHELNQPGCYREVQDTSVIAQFKLIKNATSKFLYKNTPNDIYLLAWTTTPWTLPSNTALGVGKKINYLLVETINKYSGDKISVVIAKDLYSRFFNKKNSDFNDYLIGNNDLPSKIISAFIGVDLEGLSYEQLLPYAQPENGKAFVIITADFVTTEDGTGIVHLAPSFGSDDNLAAKKNNIGSLTLVDEQGKFTCDVEDLAGRYVKNEYYTNKEVAPKISVDIEIVIKLKKLKLCFHSEKYLHSYPHCWRTDKPILYYPINSWFIKTTSYKERMIELNNEINWKPKSTGEGRFGNWLENLVDWNLSRSRFWGIPIPIWRNQESEEEICIGSVAELKLEIEKSISAGFMTKNPLKDFSEKDFSEKNYLSFDLHKPYVDEIILVSKNGNPLKREEDLIDVWFDSGSMPYAQLHYPFENKLQFENNFPADFIAEGVDQTRGWFFTLHAISTMLFDSVAYKNVVSNGLVLDKEGNKMSKRLNNAIDPFETLNNYGADATRWYMIVNAQPWDNLKFDENGVLEVQRKFFGTLYNTYSFFALYANIDGFCYKESDLNIEKRDELDKWIISELNSLIKETQKNFEDYEPTKNARLIQDFVINKLSNWYVRLSRRRFWKGNYNEDKMSAYQTLYNCLEKIAIITSPIAPFFMDNLFQDLNNVSKKSNIESVHLTSYPTFKDNLINKKLEEKMQLAQNITTLALSLRKKEQIRVRQPLNKVLIPVFSKKTEEMIRSIERIILQEINVKKIEYLQEDSDILVKKIKPNYKKLGPKYGKKMQLIANMISAFSKKEIRKIENEGKLKINDIVINLSDVEIVSGDIPGYIVASDETTTVALDINISPKLEEEGLAREFVNRIQGFRKDKGYNIIDNIEIYILKNDISDSVIKNNLTYICDETLCKNIVFVDKKTEDFITIELVKSIKIQVLIKQVLNG